MHPFKNIFFALASLTLVSTVSALPLQPKHAFTPKGFDTNDNAQVVLAGAFSDYCMKVGSTHHRVDSIRKKIYIEQTASTTNHCNELEMYIPYMIVVDLGTLKAGQYDVMVKGLDQKYIKMSTLPIETAKGNGGNTSDERLYAPVSALSFNISQTSTSPVIEIKGVFSNSCIVLDDIKVNKSMGDVFEVLPVVINNKNDCVAELTPFSKTITLHGFPEHEALIHVRTMNGQSLNKVITALDRIKGL